MCQVNGFAARCFYVGVWHFHMLYKPNFKNSSVLKRMCDLLTALVFLSAALTPAKL